MPRIVPFPPSDLWRGLRIAKRGFGRRPAVLIDFLLRDREGSDGPLEPPRLFYELWYARGATGWLYASIWTHLQGWELRLQWNGRLTHALVDPDIRVVLERADALRSAIARDGFATVPNVDAREATSITTRTTTRPRTDAAAGDDEVLALFSSAGGGRMPTLETLAPFVGAAAMETVQWYQLRERLTEAKYRRLLRSPAYWAITVAMAVIGGIGTLIYFQARLTPGEFLVAGAAFPSLLKKLIGAFVKKQVTLGGPSAREAPTRDGDAESQSAVTTYLTA